MSCTDAEVPQKLRMRRCQLKMLSVLRIRKAVLAVLNDLWFCEASAAILTYLASAIFCKELRLQISFE